jgi:hypothetical protein
MVFAEEIRRAILQVADERGPDKTFDPADVARSIDAKNWPQIVDQVKFVAGILINEGKIIAKKKSGNILLEFSKAPG